MAINYCTNPSVETDLTGYSTSGSATNTRPSGDTKATGLYCLQCAADAGFGWGFFGSFGIPGLQQYTFSFDCWLTSGGDDWVMSLTGFDNADGFVENITIGSTFTATAAKQRVSITGTPANASTTKLRLDVYRGAAAAGTLRADAFRIAPGTDATYPLDGTTRRIRQQFQLRPY